MNISDFTKDDFDLLIKGLDSIRVAESGSDAMTGLLLGMFKTKDGDEKDVENYIEDQKLKDKQKELERADEHKKIDVLKARLVLLANSN
jgi:hypothetical protein